MRYLLIISTLTTSLMFSAASWAEWTKVASAGGTKFYVDVRRLKKVDGLVYVWEIRDRLEPDSNGDMSTKMYSKVDCDVGRSVPLSMSLYKLPMAEGNAYHTFTPSEQWAYHEPGSVAELQYAVVCMHANIKFYEPPEGL